MKQPSEAQQASFWDQQIANGNLSMCSVKYPTYVNVMLYGESGLGKTVSAMHGGSSVSLKQSCWKVTANSLLCIAIASPATQSSIVVSAQKRQQRQQQPITTQQRPALPACH
jgi:hypothetical protein